MTLGFAKIAKTISPRGEVDWQHWPYNYQRDLSVFPLKSRSNRLGLDSTTILSSTNWNGWLTKNHSDHWEIEKVSSSQHALGVYEIVHIHNSTANK